MDPTKLQPILTKESILKTANAKELGQSPQDVLQRYQMYALTHVPLGDTGKQLTNLQRVVAENKFCAIGTIVGPYGYGKTSTAVHLWNELREKKILAVPPFLWVNLQQLVDAVYHWMRYEFERGPAKFVDPLKALYERYAARRFDRLADRVDIDTARDLFEQGLLNLELRPDDVVGFYSEATILAEKAGYRGLAVFTDELQATVAEYRPSRDQFFNDLFQIVKDTLGRPGKWAIIISTDDDTEGMISRLRADLLQRMQSSAIYFRVKDVYNRRQYPAELWSAFEVRFAFDGSEVILPETLESIGQIAARDDLGAGPRMVTNALSLAVAHYEKHRTVYTPLHFVNEFLEGQVLFDQRGKFATAVRKALDNVEVQSAEPYQNVVKLLAAYPAGCPEPVLARFDLKASFLSFPALARRELVVERSEGYTLRYLLEDDRPPEYVEQRLTSEFARRYAPGAKYAGMAAQGLLVHVLLEETFGGKWKGDRPRDITRDQMKYRLQTLTGTFDNRFPQRNVTLAIAAVPQSPAPVWEKLDQDADIELRFELNYNLAATEPSQLLVAPERPDVAVFQLNLNASDENAARTILPDLLFDYYSPDRLTPLLTLALVGFMFENSGELPDDVNRVKIVAGPLRQYALTLLLGEKLKVHRQEFQSAMVGHDRIRDLFKAQCRLLYPNYKTLMTGSRWQQDLQQYNYALERVIADEGVSVVRGRRSWETTKNQAADAFRIPGLSLTRLETLLDTLGDLIEKEEYSGRSGDSPIRLRFHLHPLEQQWLEQLDQSPQTANYNGLSAPALYAIELIRQTGRQGYTMDEIQQVLLLLHSRQFVATDQKKGLLIRAIDAIIDLQEAVQQQIDEMEANVIKLKETVLEFEAERYPIADMRAKLEAATARDDLELLKNEVRRRSAGLMSYATSQAAQRRQKYTYEVATLNSYFQTGVPAWLSQPFSESPLQDLLEQQRKNLAGVYESTLRDMREIAVKGNAFIQALPESPIEAVGVLQQALPVLKRESERQRTRLKSFDDQKEDLDNWRQVIHQMLGLEAQSRQITAKFGTDQWQQAVAALWQGQRLQIEANPLNIPNLHRELARQLEALNQKLTKWLENQREDFDKQRRRYEQVLNEAGVDTRLRIPFDQQNPVESYSALYDTVQQYLAGFLANMERRLNQAIQKIRYAEQVQGADLAQAEQQVGRMAEGVEKLRASLSPELLRDMARAEDELLRPLQEIYETEQAVAIQVQRALEKRPMAEGEAELLRLLQSIAANGEADLYSLIMRQIDQDTEDFDLEELMAWLQGLFQKNQIGIRVRLL